MSKRSSLFAPRRVIALRRCLVAACLMGGVLLFPSSSLSLPNESSPFTQSLPGEPFYGMEVESAGGIPNKVVIVTTGARYIVRRHSLQMWRRIDPAINDHHPRFVARLLFSRDIGALEVDYTVSDKRSVVVRSHLVEFTFHSDSMFFMQPTGNGPLTYTHENRVHRAPWNKGEDLDRMWTDGYGGSLHAYIAGEPAALSATEDETIIQLTDPEDTVAHMVFPPKRFDFEGLYGEGQRPFVQNLYLTSAMRDFMARYDDPSRVGTDYDGLGVFVMWAAFYTNAEFPEVLGPDRVGYRIHPAYETDVRAFIDFAHRHEFKVITYLSSPSLNRWSADGLGPPQDIEITARFMTDFREKYQTDGWFLDNGNVGTLLADYRFIRALREELGDDGVIFHHDSIDIWDYEFAFRDAYSGLKAVMIDAYVDYTLTGETGEIAYVHSPNDPYMRFFTSGYGMSQAFGAHFRESSGRAAISEIEKNRVLGQNLHGIEFNGLEGARDFSFPDASFLEGYKPGFDARAEVYRYNRKDDGSGHRLTGKPVSHFDPDVDWPINEERGWFRRPTEAVLEVLPGGEVLVEWQTNELSNGVVSYSSNGSWWDPNGPDGTVDEVGGMTTRHSVLLEGLPLPPEGYEFKIRSSNQASGLDEIIWGIVVPGGSSRP